MTEQFTEEEWGTSSNLGVMLAFAASRNAPAGAVQPPVLMSERKLRLFLVACCRACWEVIANEDCRKVIEVVERFADGEATETERETSEHTMDVIVQAALNLVPRDTDAVQRPDAIRDYLASLSVQVTSLPFSLLVRQQMYLGRSRDFVPVHPASRAVIAEGGPRQIAQAAAQRWRYPPNDELADWRDIAKQEETRQVQFLRDIFGNPFRHIALDPAWLTSDVLALARGIYDDRAFERMPILADALQDAGCDNPDVLNHCRDDKQVHVRGCWVVDLVLSKE